MSPPSRSEGMVMRIETARAPVPSQPEIVMSDGECKQSLLLQLTRLTRKNETKHFPHPNYWLSM